MTLSDSQAQARLHTLIEATPGLKLSSSAQLYPERSGDNLPLLLMERPHGRAVIALQGAQVLEFQARGQNPILWLSPKAQFIKAKAIRGGIPICAPWFGPHVSDNTKPQHGFARNEDWHLDAVTGQDHQLELLFKLDERADLLDLHPWKMSMSLRVILGESLTLELSASNLDTRTMPFSWALHSYFPVRDIEKTRVRQLPHDMVFPGEVDQVVNQVPQAQIIEQGENGPHISVAGEQAPSAIVWNPGKTKAANMADLGLENYRHFVCVERGAAGPDTCAIEPGETLCGRVEISWVD